MTTDSYDDGYGDYKFNFSITHAITPTLKHKNFDVLGFDHNNELIIGNLYTDNEKLMMFDASDKKSWECIYIGKMVLTVKRYLEGEGYFDEYPQYKDWILHFNLILDKERGKSQT